MTFNHPISECDVEDRNALAAYRIKREEWLTWLQGDPQNSINRQLYGMMWDDAAFRVFNEARRFATEDSPTGAVAPLLASLLDKGFVATQVLAITRLVDKRNDVISLRRLLDDIEAHTHLLTREIFVCHDGLPFDPAAAERAYWAREGYPTSGAMYRLPTEGPDAFDTSSLAHEAFDTIAVSDTGPRARGDRIDAAVFTRLRQDLTTPEIAFVLQLRHKFVAHAADSPSRKNVGIERFGISLDQLEAAQCALVQAAQKIELELLWGSSRGVVPIPQYGQFMNLDLPVVPADRLKELHAWWEAHCGVREKWTRQG